ncbi:hypothetical protein [Streptomyces clavuligerus]|uniref:Uncharacterized protein n=1 Tax=Streptomyces clavuligerus TaxID=1901 RepID=B5GMP2_STRCL|nr:hypothetical protein [Streptomyces clavuligerus]ANW22438.1 hypothetical protein BB341_29400 [Streptomyces clavuligerus]AXU17342.1 hypothetical protein D1794_32525 [Streptomyces clavuligerus]EDY47588.1 conserved hypothetical protein [Streptomyces clavuligerus]EFG04546.1 Hypothetical protein SCLAV_p1060 [Streptomyces clavuligerus]MBY6307005.1 hypothetical protein [Streptomyces clavuligerus]
MSEGSERRTSPRFAEDLEFRSVSGPLRYTNSTDKTVKYLTVADADGETIGYIWGNDEDDAAGWCRRLSGGGHAFNLGQRWVAALRDARSRGVAPTEALAELLRNSDPRLPSHIASTAVEEAPTLQTVKDLAAHG